MSVLELFLVLIACGSCSLIGGGAHAGFSAESLNGTPASPECQLLPRPLFVVSKRLYRTHGD